MELSKFQDQINRDGFVIFDEIVQHSILFNLREDIPRRLLICKEWQKRNGVDEGMEGAAHHVVGGSDSLNEFLCSMYLDDFVHSYFDGPYILNSFGALSNLPYSSETYRHGQQFHRDVRTFSPGFRLMLNMLVMVDDFTLDNGATKLVPGTHRVEERPDDDYLNRHTIRAIGRAGTIILFDSNLWHSAAPNLTASPRMALTLTFSRPFFKQQMDYPRLLGESFPPNENMRQLLGYNARVPASYDEWYQPPQKRMYKPGQG